MNESPRISIAAIAKKPQLVFVVFALFFGLLTVFATPPFQVPDETNHFYRILQISEGKILAEVEDSYLPGGKAAGGYLPESVFIMASTLINDFKSGPKEKRNLANILKYRAFYPGEEKKKFIIFSNTALYSPLLYLPQTAGTVAAKALNLSWLEIFYAGRLCALLFWIGCVYFAIKAIPTGKWLLCFLALSPMALFEAGSLSADSTIIGVSFLFIAGWLKAAVHDNPSGKELAVLTMLAMVIALSKPVYIPILLLFLLMPAKKTGIKKYALTACLVFIFPFMLAVLWWRLNEQIYHINIILFNEVCNKFMGSGRLSPPEQLRVILYSPLEYIKVITNTWEIHWKFYIRTYVGGLGQLDTYLPDWLVYSYLCVLPFLALTDNPDRIRFSLRRKAFLFLVWLAVMGLLHTAMFMTATYVGSDYITGMQGRYFIPVGLLFFFVFTNPYLRMKEGALFTFAVTALPVCLITMISVLIERYFGS